MPLRGKSRVLALLLIGAGLMPLIAQTAPPTSEIRLERLSLEHGLTQSSVYALTEDSQGYLWVGTEHAADRFDGHTFQALRSVPGASPSLTSHTIRTFFTDRDGDLWIGTHHGLNRVELMSGQIEHFLLDVAADDHSIAIQEHGIAESCTGQIIALTRSRPWLLEADRRSPRSLMTRKMIPDQAPAALVTDDQGAIWMTDGRYLWRLPCGGERLETMLELSLESHLRQTSPNALAIGPGREILWATAAGLIAVDPATGREISRTTPSQTGLEGERVEAVAVDSGGQIWLALPNRIVRVDSERPGSWEEKLNILNAGVAHGRLQRLQLAESGDGLIWLAGHFGVAVYRPGGRSLQLLDHQPGNPESLPPTLGRVGYTLLADRFGVVWIGANLAGLARYVPEQQRFRHIRDDSPGVDNVIRGVVEQSLQNQTYIWTGSDESGVTLWKQYDDGGVEIVTRFRQAGPAKRRIPSDHAYAMARNPADGRVWIGAQGWLGRADARGPSIDFVPVDSESSGISPRVMAFSTGGERLYVADARRIWMLDTRHDPDDSTLELLLDTRPDPDLSSISALKVASDGRLLVGTQRGMLVVDPGSLNIEYLDLAGNRDRVPANYVFSLAESPNGILWIGTRGGGLAQVPLAAVGSGTPAIDWWSTANGLVDDTIYAILPEPSGQLWISSNRGLMRFDPDSGRIRHYGPHDGLRHYEFNGRVADIGPSGQYYFGGINGFNLFRLESIADHPAPPLVRLQGAQVNDRLLETADNPSGPVMLRHRDNYLVLDYVALHTVAPERNRHAYKLEGLETEWVDAGTARRARYPGLPPGDYRFWVKAANADGVWSEPELLFQARIQPPPWQHPFAYLIYVLLVLAGLAITWQIHRRRRRALEALVARRTSELAERNEQVSRQARELEKALASRETLYANVSHELRTPLTLIRAGFDRLKRNPADAEALELGERYVRRLDRLVDQLLDLSRVRADAFPPADSPWPVNRMLKELVRDHAPLAEDRKLQLDLVLEGEWQTRCNRELFDKCLTNLLSNAIKYTPAGGQVVLRLNGCAESAEIEVGDTGPGIAPEEQAIIFERFQRRLAHENQAEKGAGIGLALVREAAVGPGRRDPAGKHPRPRQPFHPCDSGSSDHPNRYRPTVNSDKTNKVTRPTRNRPNPQSSSRTCQDPTSRANRLGTLLIVEDNRDLRRHLKGLLSDQWKIITARDGRQALARLAAHDIDVIVSDIMMPNMDGLDLLKRIRNDLATSHIPFLILTARRDAETRLQGLKLAADAILTKPFNDQELRLTLANTARAIESRRRHDRAENGDQSDTSPRDQAFIDQVNAVVGRELH
jgi:signal transduction histidine kinase/CheY-like chemotaxis protein/ligand-binding sensor domain-containing protein